MRKLLFIASAVALAALMCGACCACRKGKNNKPLIGTEWHLVRMMETDLSITGDQFNFRFGEDGRVAGVGACNRMMGSYAVTYKGGMKFSEMASTRMMCPDVDLETKLGGILDATTHYEIDGDMLMLLHDGEVQAVFKAVDADGK